MTFDKCNFRSEKAAVLIFRDPCVCPDKQAIRSERYLGKDWGKYGGVSSSRGVGLVCASIRAFLPSDLDNSRLCHGVLLLNSRLKNQIHTIP